MPGEQRWNFEKVGLSYRCWDTKIQVEFRLTHIKRSRGDLSGELAVHANFKGVKTHNGVLHVARFNVLSSSTRASLAKTLERRTPGFDMDWFDGLEWLCQNVILAEQAGEPIEEIGNLPRREPGQQFMVEPLIVKGSPALLFGPGGAGKSLIALACALSVSCGIEIIPGIHVTVHGPVLYLDWETTRETVNERAQSIARGHGFTPENIYYRNCTRPLADDAEELSTLVASKGIVLVIVDSAAYAMGAQGEYGDANEAVLRMHAGLRLIGVTSQIVDHVNKVEAKLKKGGSATPYGSAYKTNAVRMSWEVRKASSDSGLAIDLYHAKSNDTALLDPIGISLDWTPESIVFRSGDVGLEDEEDGGVTADAIVDLLSDGAAVPLNTIAKTLAIPKIRPENTVRTTVYRMAKRGELTLTDRGYRLTAFASDGLFHD